MKKLPRPETYMASAGNRRVIVVASSFNHALALIFDEFGAGTFDDLPQPFDMRRVESGGVVRWVDREEDLRALRLTCEDMVSQASDKARVVEKLLAAEAVISELRELQPLLRALIQQRGDHLWEMMRNHDLVR